MRNLISVLLLIALPLAASANECKFTAVRNADIDAAGLKDLMLTLGSTDLDIRSAPGLTKVEVRGTACASDASKLQDLQVNGVALQQDINPAGAEIHYIWHEFSCALTITHKFQFHL